MFKFDNNLKTTKMKLRYPNVLLSTAFILVLLFLLNIFSSTNISLSNTDAKSLSDTTKNKFYYLEMKGNVRIQKGDLKEEIKPLDSALITIYQGDIPYSEIFTNKKGKCFFKLPLDKTFKIEVSKQGFITKFFEVITKVPADKRGEYSFTFDIDIFEEVKGLDVSVLKKPIAKVSYNLNAEQFAYDVAYTNKINLDLKKMYKNYYLLEKLDKDTTLFNNDTSTTKKVSPQKK